MNRTIIIALSALLPLSAPAFAEPVRTPNLNDRIADLCTASDVDLVGKRLARQCRAAVRAQWQEEQRLAAAKDSAVKVAERR